jgi:AcrR family transcriptional regulator
MPVKRVRQRDRQAEVTRTALLAVARRLFAQRGYPSVSVDEIVQAAKLTKGALYHHFQDKLELFRAVVEEIEREIAIRLTAAAARPGTAMDRLRAACQEYLDACVVEEVGRIVVLDSPAVLGWDSWCKLNLEYGLGFFTERLRAIRGDDPGVPTSAQMLLGALNVAGRVIAQSDDRKAARVQVGPTIDRLLAGVAGPLP